VQCPAKKFHYKLTKCTVTDIFFRLKYLMYSDHSTFYSVLNFLWQLQTSFDISLMIRRQTSQLSITIDKSIRKKQKQQNIQRFFNVTASADFSDIYLMYFYLISVFLYNVLYFIKRWFTVTNFTLPRLFQNPAISNFFPFPLGLRNSGVRLYVQSNNYEQQIFQENQ